MNNIKPILVASIFSFLVSSCGYRKITNPEYKHADMSVRWNPMTRCNYSQKCFYAFMYNYFETQDKAFIKNGGKQFKTNKEKEIEEVDSLLKAGILIKLKGEWYKKTFHSYYYKNFLKTIPVNKKLNDKQIRDYIFMMIRPKYAILYVKKKKNRIKQQKVIYIGYRYGEIDGFWNEYGYAYKSDSLYNNYDDKVQNYIHYDGFQYYYDGKDYYLLSYEGFHTFDKYVKEKMGIKSIMEERLDEIKNKYLEQDSLFYEKQKQDKK